jgi:hypothetical protein
MKQEDLTYLRRAVSSQFREKYKNLETMFPPAKDKQADKHYVLCWNITQLVQLFDDLEAQFIDSSDFLFHAMIEALNVIGHYKHYYVSRVKAKTTVIVYLNSHRDYNNHTALLDKVKKACAFFPGILYVDPISQKENSYPHIVHGIIEHLKARNDSRKVQTIVHVYSVHTVDMALMLSTPSSENRIVKLTNFKHFCYTRNMLFARAFGDKEFYYKSFDKPALETLFTCVGVYMGTVLKGAAPVAILKKKGEKLAEIHTFVEKYRGLHDGELVDAFVKNMIPEESQSIVGKYLDEHEWTRNKFVLDVVGVLIEQWGKKIQDYNIIKEDASVRMLQQHDLQTSWLLF